MMLSSKIVALSMDDPQLISVMFLQVVFILLIVWLIQIVSQDKNPKPETRQGLYGFFRLKLGFIAGFPISLHLSLLLWPLMFLMESGGSLQALMIFSSLWTSVLIHELAHALSCYVLGLGRGSITLWYMGGYFIPFSLPGLPFHLENSERVKFFLMIAAGPFSNLVLAGITYGVYQLFPIDLLLTIARVNLFLAALNLLPIPRLDGGQMLYTGLSRYIKWQKMILTAGILLLALAVFNIVGFVFIEDYPLILFYRDYIFFGFGISAIHMGTQSDQDINQEYIEALGKECRYLLTRFREHEIPASFINAGASKL
jgi:Zn-dependent protease